MTSKHLTQEQSFALYEDIRAHIDENPGTTVEKACEAFGIQSSRYYFIQSRYKSTNNKRKKKVDGKMNSEKASEDFLEERRPTPSVSTIRVRATEPVVTPEVVPMNISGDDLVFVTVARAKNIGTILDQILPRL